MARRFQKTSWGALFALCGLGLALPGCGLTRLFGERSADPIGTDDVPDSVATDARASDRRAFAHGRLGADPAAGASVDSNAPALRPEFLGAQMRLLEQMRHQSGALPLRMPLSLFEPLGASQALEMRRAIVRFCAEVDLAYKRTGWSTSPCQQSPWTFLNRSEDGFPLLYWEFADQQADLQSRSRLQTTLVLGGVHPDELTPIHLAFAFAEALRRDPSIYRNSRVIVAPLVNPDGFFVTPPRRTNANGIDLNRNFATADWWNRASELWRTRRKADPRHFPGFAPNTEEGTRFQAALVAHFEPDKILSIHAPLGFLDYDGPGEEKLAQSLSPNEMRAMELADEVSRSSNNYRIMNYRFFPGSLGNFAGNDRRIPTITVELDSTDPKRSEEYFREFLPGLSAAVQFQFKRDLILVSQGESAESDGSGVSEPAPVQQF